MDSILDKTFEMLKIDSAQINSVRKVGFTMYENVSVSVVC